MPNPVKPAQLQLTGWITNIVEGNKISFDTSTSPILNHTNSKDDRKLVIGKKCLAISDKTNFKRQIFQTITSSSFIKLGKANYTLIAKVRNRNDFAKLEMYAVSNSKTFKYRLENENAEWTTNNIKNIIVEDGKVEIGFWAEGSANSFCYLDDISLVKE